MKTIDMFNGFPWPRKALRFLCSQLDGLEARICELESAHAADAVDRDTEVEQELGRELRDAIMESTRFAAELRDANGVIARQNESIAKLRRTNARADEWEESAKRELQDAHERIGALEGDLARANATIGHLEETARLLTEQRDEARMRFILNLTPSATPDNLSTERAPASAEEPQPGMYLHWKGGRYLVVDVATHTETNERVVVYCHHCANSPGVWARPVSSWNELVIWPDGSSRPRFVRDP